MKMRTNSTRLIALMILLSAFSLAAYAWAGPKSGQDISGKYLRETEDERAELEIKTLPKSRVRVTGISNWGTTQKYGPNIGELDFVADIRNGCIRYSEKIGKGQYYILQLTPTRMGLLAKEEHGEAKFGLNVTFEGEYKKVKVRSPDNHQGRW
jgi:hypothetical protein